MKHQTTHSVYLIDSRLGLARLGVAPEPRQRLRELQVGSPVRLELVLATHYRRREDARAVAAELARRFAARRAHGQWYRVTRAELERALASGQMRAAPARAARARAAAGAGEASPAAGAARPSRLRTEKERAYQRRRRAERTAKQKRAARLLAGGASQVAVAAALGVTARTLRNWRGSPAFARMLEREHERRERPRPGSAHRRPGTRLPAPAALVDRRRGREREPTAPAPAGEASEAVAAIEARRLDSYERWLDSNDARRGKLTPAERKAGKRR